MFIPAVPEIRKCSVEKSLEMSCPTGGLPPLSLAQAAPFQLRTAELPRTPNLPCQSLHQLCPYHPVPPP